MNYFTLQNIEDSVKISFWRLNKKKKTLKYTFCIYIY